jgi:N-acetylgalactosamine kinase
VKSEVTVYDVGCALCFRWGGCIVALTTKNTVNDYISTLKDKFYERNPAAYGKNLDSLVFATGPNAGAEIYEVKK